MQYYQWCNASQIDKMCLENGTVLAALKEIHDRAIKYFQEFIEYNHIPSDISHLVSAKIIEEKK